MVILPTRDFRVPFKDRVVERPNTYRMVNNGDGTVTLTRANGNVLEEGTPLNSENLNAMQDFVFTTVNEMITYWEDYSHMLGHDVNTVFNANGSITETIINVGNSQQLAQKDTVFNSDGSILETYIWHNVKKKFTVKTIFNADGSIKYEVREVSYL